MGVGIVLDVNFYVMVIVVENFVIGISCVVG